MTRIQRLMKLHRLMDQAGEGGSDAGGTGTGSGDGSSAGEGGEAGTGGAGEGTTTTAKAKPSDGEARLLREVMAKKTALEAANVALAAANDRLKQFDGIDVATARQLLLDKEEQDRVAAEARGDYERLKTQMANSHATEKETLQGTINSSAEQIGALSKQIAELTVGSSFASSSFIPTLIVPASKVRALFGSHFEFKDGNVVGYDKPASAADRAPLVDGAGNPLSFDAALKKIVDADPDKDDLYRSTVKAGSRSTTTKAKAAPEHDDTVVGISRIALGLKNLAKQSSGK